MVAVRRDTKPARSGHSVRRGGWGRKGEREREREREMEGGSEGERERGRE